MSAETKQDVAQPAVSLPRQMRDIALDLSQQTCNANAQFARGYCRGGAVALMLIADMLDRNDADLFDIESHFLTVLASPRLQKEICDSAF